MNHTFDKELKKISNIELSITAFLSLGVAALAIPFGMQALSLITLPIVGGMFAIPNKKALLQDQPNQLLNRGLTGSWYAKKLVSSIIDFVDSADNITEKKYRVFFSFMWAQSQKIKLSNLLDMDKVDQWSEQIAVDTKIDLYGLFINGESAKKIDDYLNEDLALPDAKERLNNAQKAFGSFRNSGMLGRLISGYYFDNTRLVAVMQDYKLSAEDLKAIQKTTRYNNKMGAALINSPLDLIDLNKDKQNYLYELLEKNTEHKDILKNFLASYNELEGLKNNAPGEEFIEYLEYSHKIKNRYQELENTLPIKESKVIKRNKI